MLRRKFLERPRMKPMIMLATIFVIVLFILLLDQQLWSGTDLKKTQGTFDYQERMWVLKSEDGRFQKPVKFHEFYPFQKDVLYTMSTPVTYDGSHDEMPYAFLHIAHMYCRVLLDEQVLFSYMPEDVHRWDRSQSPGFIYKAIPLGKDCQGRLMKIQFLPVMETSIDYEVPEITFGDYRTMTRRMIARDLPHNILTVLCMMLGLSALIFSAASLTGSDYREGFNIGNFALLVSMYFFTECHTNFYYIGNPYYLYFVNFTVFSLMPVSFMGVMRECMTGFKRRLCTAIITVEMAFFTLEMVLHVSGIADMREILPCIHITGFLELFLIACMFLTMKERKKRFSMVMQLIPVLGGMILDAIIYWSHLDIGANDAAFTTVGVLIFLISQLITKVIRQARKLSTMQQHTIEGMATLIEGRDGSTGAHVRNTGIYAKMIAEDMSRRRMYPKEINNEFIDMIGRIAPLHDVGKIRISDTILNKPGKFTPEEYEIMKTHAAMGGEIIGEILRKDLEPEMLQMAVDIATYHHERWDGTGYPTGKKGTEIPLCARIMAAADVFDALSSKRVYKPEMEIDEVFHEMVINENKQFQKEIVEVVLALRPQLEACVEKNRKAAVKLEKLQKKA